MQTIQNENVGTASDIRKLQPSTKRASMLQHFIRLGSNGINCFQAANHYHDYVLRSTVSDLQRLYGLTFSKERERVPNAFGKLTDCVRYWLPEQEMEKAIALLPKLREEA